MTSPTGEKKHTSDDRVGPEAAANVPTSRDLLLIALTVASGAVDVISYFGLGKIFSAFMTGNIVFLGFGIAEIKVPDIFALSMFAVGSYLGLRITDYGSADPSPWTVATGRIAGAGVRGDRGSRLPRRVVSNGRTPHAEHQRCAHHPVLTGYGAADRGGPMARCAGRVHYRRNVHPRRIRCTFAESRSRSEIPRLGGVLVALVAGAVGGGLLFLQGVYPTAADDAWVAL